LTDESLATLLKEVNPNGDNVISWEEFLKDYESDL
jgi:Ca2+-binding EF-hand superfamily protein